MRVPATSKLFKHAKATGRKAFVVYLGDPESKDITEMTYEGTLYPHEFEELKKHILDLLDRNRHKAALRREQLVAMTTETHEEPTR